MKEYVLTVDLKRSPDAVRAYERHHRRVWPEVLRSLGRVGVKRMKIYRLERRLVMLLGTSDDFDLKKSFARHTASDPACQEWEALMEALQVAPPGAAGKGRLWTRMKEVFDYRDQRRSLARRGSRRRPAGRAARR